MCDPYGRCHCSLALLMMICSLLTSFTRSYIWHVQLRLLSGVSPHFSRRLKLYTTWIPSCRLSLIFSRGRVGSRKPSNSTPLCHPNLVGGLKEVACFIQVSLPCYSFPIFSFWFLLPFLPSFGDACISIYLRLFEVSSCCVLAWCVNVQVILELGIYQWPEMQHPKCNVNFLTHVPIQNR